MIINPGPIFPNFQATEWKYIGRLTEHRQCIDIVCGCQMEPIFKVMEETTSIKMHKIVNCRSHVMAFKKEKPITFWLGKCEDCGAIYWTCESFDWVPWLDDYSSVRMILNNTPIRHVMLDDYRAILIEQKTHLRFDEQGKLYRVT